jgi:hypothetical protein
MNDRWDETWHRLRQWTNGQAQSERLAAQVLMAEGYAGLDPSHPLGGPDGGMDGVCHKHGKTWLIAVFFPRGQERFPAIETKLRYDLRGVPTNGADGLVFVTNQEVTLRQRVILKNLAGSVPLDLYHLERITAVLDQPAMSGVRRQFLSVNFDPSVDEALSALTAEGRDEQEIRDAIVGVAAAQRELLGRGVEPGGYRCTKCGSSNIERGGGEHGGRAFDVTMCGDCGEIIDVCI